MFKGSENADDQTREKAVHSMDYFIHTKLKKKRERSKAYFGTTVMACVSFLKSWERAKGIKSQDRRSAFVGGIVGMRFSGFAHTWGNPVVKISTWERGTLTLIFSVKQ